MTSPDRTPHYMVDYYAVLGIDRSAGLNEIQAAFRAKIQLYHPDKYAHLAPEFQALAQERTRVLTDAQEHLTDPQEKTLYDSRLAEWDGPVSTTGRPMVNLSRPDAAAALLTGNYAQILDEVAKKLNIFSGFDEITFTFAQDSYLNARHPQAEIIQTIYRGQLAKKDQWLALQDSFLREAIGLDGSKPTASFQPYAYIEATAADIAEGRTAMEQSIDETLLQVVSGEKKLLGTGGEHSSVFTPDEIAILKQEGLKRYEAVAAELGNIARQREEIIHKRLEVVERKYITTGPLSSRVLIGLRTPTESIWIWASLKETDITFEKMSAPVTHENLREDPAIAKAIQEGHSVMIVTHEEGLPLQEELTSAAMKHFEEHEAQALTSESPRQQ